MLKIILSIIILSNAFYLSNIIDRYTITSLMEYAFIFIFFMGILYVLTMLINRYLLNRNKDKVNVKVFLIISLVGSLLTVILSDKLVYEKYSSNELKVMALKSNNTFAFANEVWIEEIIYDGINLDLSKVELNEGWHYNQESGALFTEQIEESQTILIPPAEDIEIKLKSHEWSGKAHIALDEQIKEIDLCNLTSQEITYDKESIYIDFSGIKKDISSFWVIIYYINALIFYTSAIFVILILYRQLKFVYQKTLIQQIIIAIWTVIGMLLLNILNDSSSFILFVGFLLGYFYLDIINNKHILKYKNWISTSFVLLIAMYFSFSLIGHETFFGISYVNLTIINILLWIAVAIYMIPIILLFLLVLEILGEKVSNTDKQIIKNVGLKGLSIFLIGVGIYFVAFWPGSMSPDSFAQWGQALGMWPLDDWHPVMHTLIIRGLINIVDSPAIVVVAQVGLFSILIYSYCNELSRKGLSQIIILSGILIFTMVPSNGQNFVTLWKDIPYTMSLAWLTVIIYRIIDQKKGFIKSKINLLGLLICLILSSLLRHNGVIVLMIVSIMLIIYAIKNRILQIIPICLGAILCVGVIKGPVYNNMEVIPTSPGTKYCAMTNDMIGVLVADGELGDSTYTYLTDLMPLEEHKSLYKPYDFDQYIFNQEYPVLDIMSDQNISDYIMMYVDTFVKKPLLLIQNRLNGMELMWNITPADDSFNYRGEMGTTMQNEFGFFTPETKLNILMKAIINFSSEVELIDIFVWRVGIYIVALMIIALYLYKNRKEVLLIFIPLLANVLSLGMTMYHQSYRYVWFIFVLYWFILGIALIAKSKIKE